MLKQFEIHGGVVKNLNTFLAERGIDLKTAMDAEETNKLVAAIIHEGLPGMVRRIYSLQKMQTFFLGEEGFDGGLCGRAFGSGREKGSGA